MHEVSYCFKCGPITGYWSTHEGLNFLGMMPNVQQYDDIRYVTKDR